MKLTAAHADTCLPSYWGGHHLPHIQVIVWNGMTLKELKQSLHSELNEGAVAGRVIADDLSDEWWEAAKRAVSDITAKPAHTGVVEVEPADPEERQLFLDLEPDNEDDDGQESVYAFFVFIEEDV
jgi:hypothetical protein